MSSEPMRPPLQPGHARLSRQQMMRTLPEGYRGMATSATRIRSAEVWPIRAGPLRGGRLGGCIPISPARRVVTTAW